MPRKGKTVFVGLSGGVDSSIAAARLLEQGYNVVGVFIKVWHPSFLPCSWEEERRDAMRVAAHLEIPFLTCDAEQEYYEDVARYFISTYAAGRTPNPDVMCNKYVKFGAFLRFAKNNGADYIATGHYAQIKENLDGAYELHRGIDTNKDQSYFLWTLTQKELAFVLFPLGSSSKSLIRDEAASLKLPTAEKKDSQGICFLGHVDIHDFLKEFLTLKPGKVLDTDGTVIGNHKSSFVYTLGQRHGFTINTGDITVPHYVVAIDNEENTLTVDTKPPKNVTNESFILENCSWTSTVPEDGKVVSIQTRYRQKPSWATIKKLTSSSIEVTPKATVAKPVSGQSCVLYEESQCLGGGIIV